MIAFSLNINSPPTSKRVIMEKTVNTNSPTSLIEKKKGDEPVM